MFNNILVVCIGNICRSPTAAAVLKKHLPNKNISSAGIFAQKSNIVGCPADKSAIEIAKENGIDITTHRSQQLTPALCHQSDLILVMEKFHIELISDMAQEARGKVMLFAEWIEKQDIIDPYKRDKDVFIHVFNLIEQAALAWTKKL